jgi:hypothetical protein
VVSLSFTLIESDRVDLTTFAPLTLILHGATHTLSVNEEFTLALRQDVYIPLWNNPAYATKQRVSKSHPEPDAILNLR